MKTLQYSNNVSFNLSPFRVLIGIMTVVCACIRICVCMVCVPTCVCVCGDGVGLYRSLCCVCLENQIRLDPVIRDNVYDTVRH